MGESDIFSFQRSQCVQGGRQSGVVGVDKVHGGLVGRGRKVGENVRNTGGESFWADGFDVTEGYLVGLFCFGSGDIDVK